MAKNDWIVAGLNNPDFSTADFSNIADMSVDNTQLLSRDEYLKSNFIKNNPAFRDDNGQFSERKFDDYYKRRVEDFGDFQQGEFAKGPALDMFDIDRAKDTPVQDIHFDVRRGVNPDRQAIGIEGVNAWSDPVFSQREIAKQNRVFDTATGEFKDYTVNEHTFVENPIEWVKDQFRDPLVMATWDEDGEHVDPITGITRQHKKGDKKLNDKGTYYYETLNGRNVLGKDVLSTFDTFTVDGQGINKYDFFDSNDIEKSAAGTVAKNIVALLPLFTPVGGAYSALMVGREMAKSLPMLYGMATALVDAETPSWMNTLAAKASAGTTSTSDYAQQKTFAFENFGNLVADVALQWGQQKTIASGFQLFKSKPKEILEDAERQAMALYNVKRKTLGDSKELLDACRNKFLPAAQKAAEQSTQLGRDASLAYMAVVSNTDVYQDMLEHGASKTEAAAIALGSTLGMFAVDKYAHLGEIFFDEATPDATKQARQALRNEFAAARSSFDNIAQSQAPARNKLMQYITKAADTGKRALGKFNEDLKYHSLSLAGKMLGEGMEEVSEELVTDMSKSVYELAGQFGFDTSTKDVGAWDNAFDRYAMSFLGGAIGGGVFYGKEVFDGKQFHKPKLDEDMATLIRNGQADELRKQLEIMDGEGKTGNKSLSATEYNVIDDKNGKKAVWLTTDNPETSQAKAVHDLVQDRINSIEEILVGNNVNLSDDELFDNMVLTEKRYNRYKEISQLTNYYQDFATTLDGLVNAEMAYKTAINTMEGTKDGTAIPNDTALAHLTPEQAADREKNLTALRDDIDKQRENVRDFLAGENSLDYTRKLNFAMDPGLHQAFLNVDQDAYLQTLYPGKNLSQLTLEEQVKFLTQQWPEYVQTQLKTKLSVAWEDFKEFERKVNPHLDTLARNAPGYKKWAEDMKTLVNSEALSTESLWKSYKGWNDRLDSDTDESYDNRDQAMVNPVTGVIETAGEFDRRRYNRQKDIEAYNDQQDKIWADKLTAELQKVGMSVDPQTASYLREMLENPVKDNNGNWLAKRGRLRSIIDRKINFGTVSPMLRNVLRNLNTDLSNVDELSDAIRGTLAKDAVSSVSDLLAKLNDTELTDTTGSQSTFADLIIDSNDEELQNLTLQEALDDLNEADPAYFGDLDTDSRESLRTAIGNFIGTGLPDVLGITVGDITGGNVTIGDSQNDIDVSAYVDTQFAPLQNTISSIVSSIRNNALFQLRDSLKADIVNPVGELLKGVAASNNDVLPEIDNILRTIQDDFSSISDFHQLQLNDAQLGDLNKAKNYIDMLKVYLYGASTVPGTVIPVGHNRTINEFAKAHADKLRGKWEALPEIDSDYAALFQQILDDYNTKIDYWIELSNDNSINKTAKFVRTDSALNQALWKINSKMSRSFTVGDKQYDLLDGMESVDTAQLDSDYAQIPLYNLERIIHDNVKKIADENNMSIAELVQNTNLLETLVPGIRQLNDQKSSQITDALTDEGFTDYDKILYFATLFSEDPANFFQQLNSRVTANKNIAPITVQEFSTRIAQASMSQAFRDIVAHARSLADNQETYFLTNTTIIPGVAGAGKTQVILNAIDSAIKDKPVIIAGPTEEQGKSMREAMGRPSSTTFDDLLRMLLGEDQWNRVSDAFNKASFSSSNPTKVDTEFFTIEGGSDGLAKIKLKKDAIKFKDLGKDIPAAIYLDEATHLNTLQAEIVDAYAAKVGAQVFMSGDPTQLGHSNPKNKVFNIDEGAVFAVRTPKLTISLRDSNLQKFQNNEAVRQITDGIIEKRLYAPEQEYSAYFPVVKSMMSKLNFRVYSDTELNGDMIAKSLDEGTLAKLKEASDAGKSVALITDNASSPYLTQLRDKGINIPDQNIHNLATMQGQEYDYVIVDKSYKNPDNISAGLDFMQELYTLMTRAREASIFIDNGLSDIIGHNVISRNKSRAPSILDGVNELRTKKLDILKQLDFTGATAPATSAAGSATAPATSAAGSTSGSRTTVDDFIDPDVREAGNRDRDVVREIADTDSAVSDEDLPVSAGGATDIDSFMVECYGDVTYLTASEDAEVERENPKDGKKYKAKPWVVRVPADTDAELRNLQALVDDGTEAFWYTDKLALQKMMAETKAGILYAHSWPTRSNPNSLPKYIRDRFNQTDWEAGTYEVEFRTPDAQDIRPLHSPFSEAGFDYKGQRIIANVVFKVKNKKGQWCKFDLAGINNPETLASKQGDLRESWQAKIDNPRTDAATKAKLQAMLNELGSSVTKYRNWFDDKLEKFNKNGSLSVELPKDAVQLSMTTWFRKRTGKPIRLGGRINPDRIDANDAIDLIDQNPNMVFSDIYTFTGKENIFGDHDASIKGKAVIFVTSDTLLPRDELINIYLAQKKNPDSNTPRVRMIMLDNYGMTFSQMNDQEFVRQFQQGDESRKPFRQNFTGMRMFTSLWNARAALIRFNNAVTEWEATNNLKPEQVAQLAKADYYGFVDKSDDSERVRNTLSAAGLDASHLKLLRDFNNDTLKDVPMFRLGYSANKNAKTGLDYGFHVQGFNIKDSIAYEDGDHNLCVITQDKADQFLKMINAVLRPICADPGNQNTLTGNTLGLQLLKPDTNAPWGIDEFIDFDNAKHQRSLSGLLSRQGAIMQVANGDQTMAYVEGNQWSVIPRLISSFVRTVNYYQTHKAEATKQDNLVANISYYPETGHDASKEEKVKLEMEIDEFFGDEGLLHDTDTHYDTSLFDMMNLIFHGTTDDIHRSYSADNPLMKLEDAYFKDGFFINPDISHDTEGVSAEDIPGYRNERGVPIFYKIATNSGLFTADVDLRSAGVRLSLKSLLELDEKATESATPDSGSTSDTGTAGDKVKTFKDAHPIEGTVIDMLNALGYSYEYDESTMQEAVDKYNELTEASLTALLKSYTPEAMLNTQYLVMDGKILTYKQYLMRMHHGAEIRVEGPNIIIAASDGKVYKINPENGKEILISDSAPSPSSLSMLEDKYKSGTVGSTLLGIINSRDFKDTLKSDDYGVEDETIENFISEISDVIKFGKGATTEDLKQELQTRLSDIMAKYEDIMGALLTEDEDLYNIIFENC